MSEAPSTFVAVDPGLSGAIAILYHNDIKLFDIPTMGEKTKRMIDIVQVADIFREHVWIDHMSDGIRSVIERAQAMPGQGLGATFRYGMAYGQLLGCLQSHRYPIEIVHPSKWKRQVGLVKASKEDARLKAINAFPQVAYELKRKKDHNRAEALLLAVWLQRFHSR